jgi:transcriptional regulator with XRE-family HTH domain
MILQVEFCVNGYTFVSLMKRKGLEMAYFLDMDQLATMVRARRANRGLRDVALEIGNVSPSTLSRIENGKMPDMETFLLLCDWLAVPPAQFLKTTASAEAPPQTTPDSIAIQLRSDKNLDPATANALAELVKAAYLNLAHQSGNSQAPTDRS